MDSTADGVLTLALLWLRQDSTMKMQPGVKPTAPSPTHATTRSTVLRDNGERLARIEGHAEGRAEAREEALASP